MEKFLEITYLYDFYGQLLTEKQNLLIRRYYLEDLSLGEIALQEDVSRQSIHNTIRKAENKLIGYEEKLGLFARFKEQQNQLKYIVEIMNSIQSGQDDQRLQSTISHVIEQIQQLLND